MTRIRPFAQRTIAALLAVTTSGATFVACGGGGGSGGLFGDLFVGNAARADLSGQQSALTGDLDAGKTITFPAIKNGVYNIAVTTTDNDDEVVFDVYGDDGSHLRSKTVDAPGAFNYTHSEESQHVIVFVRPWNPIDLDVEIVSLTVTGNGAFAKDRFHVNFFVVGKFTGYGAHGDLATTQDQAAFTDAVMTKVRSLFAQTGTTIGYEGFYFTPDQIRAQHPDLIAPDDQAICSAGEQVSSTGIQTVSTDDLDRYAQFGFPAGDPSFTRAHGIDVFIIHHFTKDGNVGLSPRPGELTGNGPDTALAASAFLQVPGQLIPRTPDQIATVLAHELGHFLGLQHTTTFDPSPVNPTRAIDDGISDTPACTVLTDTNGDGIVGLGDGCQDEGNLMFFQAGAQTVFSSGQTNVMRALLSIQEH
jgi:hypothetical protein